MTIPSYAIPVARPLPSFGKTIGKIAGLFSKSKSELSLPDRDETQLASESAWHATALAEIIRPAELQEQLEQIFGYARKEIFQDGMESNFSDTLIAFLTGYGNLGIDSLITFVDGPDIDSEAVAEALRWIAEIDDPNTLPKRLWLLERSLNSPFAAVRDGAVIGLGSLDDPSAIRYVEQAFERESKPLLRQNMEQLLEQLKDTEAWDKSFATSQDWLARMEEEVLKAYHEGHTDELDPDDL